MSAFRATSALSLTLLLLRSLGCEQQPNASSESSKAVVREAQKPTAEELDADFDGTTISLVPSSSHIVSGDMRPLWVATGRISNKSYRDWKTVGVHIIARKLDSEEILDTADFEVQGVPPLEAKGFRREVQLMVYPGKFRFEWIVQSAVAKTDDQSQ